MLSAGGVYAAGFIGNPVARGFGLDRGFGEFHSVYTQKVNLGEVTHADAFRKVLPAFFQGRREGRFFAYVHYLEPHFPYDPRPPFNTMFGPDAPLSLEQRGKLGMVCNVSLLGMHIALKIREFFSRQRFALLGDQVATKTLCFPLRYRCHSSLGTKYPIVCTLCG